MDYEKVVDNLKTLTTQLDQIFNKNIRKDGNKTVAEDNWKRKRMRFQKKKKLLKEETEEQTERRPQRETEDSGGGNMLEGTETEEEKSQRKKASLERKKKDKKDEKIEELTDRVKRQMAEFDNFRKRTEKEKASMFEIGAKSVIEKMLPVVDNFERGLASVPEEAEGRPLCGRYGQDLQAADDNAG